VTTIANTVVIKHLLLFKFFLLVFNEGSGGDYQRTTSRTDDWAARMLRTPHVRVLAISVLRYFSHPLENSRSTRRGNHESLACEIASPVESERK